MDFKSFKKGRGKLEKSVAKMKEQNPKFKKDERFWLPTKDDAGSSNALIRFLPQPDIEAPPTISFYQHGFKEKGKWFIDNCPSTFAKDCPVCEHIQPYWEEETEESMNYARRYSRTKQFICNILVIKDLIKPANNGKVFLFKFGIKIYEKIEEKIFPESELDTAVQIFDPWEGCGFKLKLRQKSGRNNYDQSEFSSTKGPVTESDEKLETIFNQLVDLSEFLADDKFSSYEKMAKKFNRIMKITGGKTKPSKAKPAADDKGDALLDEFEDGPDTAKSTPAAAKEEPDLPNTEADDDDFDFEDEPAAEETKAEPEKETEKAEEPKEEVKKEKKADDKGDDFNFDEDDDDFNFDD
ncbi:MAG: hypothetical protein DRP51_08990 [Candidatus Zixiibacteriota bacterium]|nr:MAG: hypothetical protein DRP51_08990 [candidate division Zixibacteria bacterium]